ncbi:MAG TPA: flavohemoglobin expression-modulating QEGLA motif protein [Gammaproteobacteria bacterium]|nr:flavohemoglobin expression-modulating QEGLA motif protein [Gammaproteobacteria bacterium]
MSAAADSLDTYKQTLRELSDRIVAAQKPIRILDHIKWEPSIQEEFFKNGARELPKVDAAYYQGRPLGFDSAKKRQEFHEIERDITRQLGQFNSLGGIMRRMCREYIQVVRMLEARGTPEFGAISEELYGSASDAFHEGGATLADLGKLLGDSLASIDQSELLKPEEKTITAEEAVKILQKRINLAFHETESTVRVLISDGILADAAAGADYIKLRKEAKFNDRDLKVLEVHEGWVHLGTTLNGTQQPVCTFLSKGPPSSTITQEGLAIFMEIITFSSYPTRLRRLANRIRAVRVAEEGGDFLQVYQFFLAQGFSEGESFANASRIFRGSTPDGAPFTKDLSYNKGFIMIYNYLRLAVRKGMLNRIPLLFCGKTTLEDMRTLSQFVDEGIIVPPRFLPPQISDLNGITAWMCYSNFLNRLDLGRIQDDYASIL